MPLRDKILGDILRQNPELLLSKFSQAVENVLKYNAVNVDVIINAQHVNPF